MPNPFAKIAFTDSVKITQDHYGTRRANERHENLDRLDELTRNEAQFISERDGSYLATVNEDGHPYLPVSGRPRRLLKRLDEKTLGYADFRGNFQYISVGNLFKNNKAALLLMDYAIQTRLKIFAETEVIDAPDDVELIQSLTMPDYKAKNERAIIVHVTAYDWNCPQHITPRFTHHQNRSRNPSPSEPHHRPRSRSRKTEARLLKDIRRK